MRIIMPRHRPIRIAIYLISFLLILLAVDLVIVQVLRRITPSYETTRITGPAVPDGPIDYVAAVENHYGAGVTVENNAVPLLLEAFGPIALPNNQPRNGITSRLGMSPLPEAGDYFQNRIATPPRPGGGKFAVPKDIDPFLQQPWDAAAHPDMAAWLDANEKPLAKIIEASKRARFFYPYNGGYRPESLAHVLLPYVTPSREASYVLLARAMRRIHAGDVAGARQDIEAVHGLARLFSQGPTAVDRVVGYMTSMNASRAEQAAAANGKLNAEQAKQWLTAITQRPPLQSIVDAVDLTERYSVLDSMQYGARFGTGKFLDLSQQTTSNGLALVLPFVPVRWEHSMRTANQWYDWTVAAMSTPDRAERRAAILSLMKQFGNYALPIDGPTHMAFRSEWPAAMFIPSLEMLDTRETTSQADRDLAKLAMALRVHKLTSGDYPASLDALKPELIGDIPVDTFNNRPFTYRRSADGYLLYSVGSNLRDDGGKPYDPTATKEADLCVVAGDAVVSTSPATTQANR